MPIEYGSFSLGAIAGSFATAIVAHLLATDRDTRNRHIEVFNKEADALARVLREEREYPHSGCDPDFSAFRRVLKKRELVKFDKAVETYNSAKANAQLTIDEILQGGVVRVSPYSSYKDPEPIIAAVDRLLVFTKRR